MLKRIRIKNFQKHRSLTLKLDPHITTIVGPSDIGKSAILRALRWVCFNKPDGTAFITDGEVLTKVQLTVDDHVITRSKGKGVNAYHLDGKQLVSFNRDVPDLVERVLNLDSTGFQLQHDSPFWFSLSAGDVSKQINSIIDLGVIDHALGNVQRGLRESAALLKGAQATLDESKRELDAMEFVPELVEQHDRLLNRSKEVHDRATELAQLRSLVEKGLTIAETKRKATQRRVALSKLTKRFRFACKQQQRVELLGDLLTQRQRLQTITDRGAVQFSEPERLMDSIVGKQKQVNSLSGLLRKIRDVEGSICQKRKQLKNVRTRLPKTCPMCGNSLRVTM